MAEFIKVNIDVLGDWLPRETDEEMHDRVYRMADISSKAFNWEFGSNEFFEAYNKFLEIAIKAREHHEHFTLISLLTLQDLFEEGGVSFADAFNTEEEIHDAFRTAVRRLMQILEHSMLGGNVLKTRESLMSLPNQMTNVSFTFGRQQYHTDAGWEDSDEEHFSVIDKMPDIEPEEWAKLTESDFIEWVESQIEDKEQEDD